LVWLRAERNELPFKASVETSGTVAQIESLWSAPLETLVQLVKEFEQRIAGHGRSRADRSDV